MDLSNQNITGHQFELNRRGYDPDTVDRHLKEIAAAVETRAQQFAELQSLVGGLQAKVQDANESEEALRLTLKAAAHAKEELLAGARDQVKIMEDAAAEKAASVVGEAEERARALTVGAETQAAAIKQEVNAQAREVAQAAVAESELLVGRIEELRQQLTDAEAALQTLSSEASPNIAAAREALDVAMNRARDTVEDPSILESAAPDTAPAVVAEPVIPEPVISEPVAPEPTEELAVAEAQDAGEQARSDDVPESPQHAEPARPPTDDRAPDDGVSDEHPQDEHPAERDAGEQHEDAPHLEVVAQQESTADISNKVDRLLEELREVT